MKFKFPGTSGVKMKKCKNLSSWYQYLHFLFQRKVQTSWKIQRGRHWELLYFRNYPGWIEIRNCQQPEHQTNQKTLSEFLAGLQIIPIFPALDLYASEKARLRKSGLSTDDFDLLIGASAVCHGLTMVTNNVSHFEKIKGIVIQDWTKPEFNSFISTD